MKSVTIIVTLAGINFLNTMGSGVPFNSLLHIAEDISLSEGFCYNLLPFTLCQPAAHC